MKKLIMLLVVLAATPAFAVLTVSMNDLGGGVISIDYSGGDPCNLPRAFALDFTIDNPGVITLTPGSFKDDGESTSTSRGFGIFPASIDINDIDGTVNSYGTPQADDADPGADPSAQHMVIELGSLYYGDGNAPATSGTLCTLTIDCNGGQDLNLTMIDELTYRGGVLTEDGAAVEVDDSIVVCADGPPLVCPDNYSGVALALYESYIANGADPSCWCNQYQCHGDADNAVYGPGWLIYSADLDALIAAWKAKVTDGHVNPCADFDHAIYGPGWTVYSADLDTLITNWKKKSIAADPINGLEDCPEYIAP